MRNKDKERVSNKKHALNYFLLKTSSRLAILSLTFVCFLRFTDAGSTKNYWLAPIAPLVVIIIIDIVIIWRKTINRSRMFYVSIAAAIITIGVLMNRYLQTQ